MTGITTPFGFRSTAAEVVEGIRMIGKRVIVTGEEERCFGLDFICEGVKIRPSNNILLALDYKGETK